MYRLGALRLAFKALAAMTLMLSAIAPSATYSYVAAQPDCHTFPETGKSVCGQFLEYWQQNGGLAQQGYPISEPFQEKSDIDGKTYTVQYFERAVFESHPENQPPYDVLLSLLGALRFKEKYPNGAPDDRESVLPYQKYFPETGKTIDGIFLGYWDSLGGLAQQGYPISEPFQEKSELDGKTYTVQYFERAVFELHPENQPPHSMLLSQLGTFRYNRKYVAAEASPTPDLYAELRQRPLKTQPLGPGEPCPTSKSRKDLRPGISLFGNGPVYLQKATFRVPDVPDIDGDFGLPGYIYDESKKAYRIKGPWLSEPHYPGPILIRGHRFDGDGVVRFDYAGGRFSPEMRLEDLNSLDADSGWRFWPSTIWVPGPGCFAFQVDGLYFTEVIVLRAIKSNTP
ncbi:MAG TPA: hypothetical protein VF952_02810 [Chloroflexia bacterium]|jgi:hypothetical protein